MFSVEITLEQQRREEKIRSKAFRRGVLTALGAIWLACIIVNR